MTDIFFCSFIDWLTEPYVTQSVKCVTYSLFQKYSVGVVVERLVWPETDCVIFFCGGEGKFRVSSRVSRGPLSAMRAVLSDFRGQIKDRVLIAGASKIDLRVDVDIKLPLLTLSSIAIEGKIKIKQNELDNREPL